MKNNNILSIPIYLLSIVAIATVMLQSAFSAPISLAKPDSHTTKQIKGHIDTAEKKYNLPPKLIYALASVESRLHPWAVYANCHGKKCSNFFTTKQGAASYIRKLQRQGVKNINVGCMQINLQYHQKKFSSIEEALDPQKNIEYGAKYLAQLIRMHKGDVTMAVRKYNCGNARYNIPYKNRVMNARAVALKGGKPEGKPFTTCVYKEGEEESETSSSKIQRISTRKKTHKLSELTPYQRLAASQKGSSIQFR